jgi:hypothetical protein
MATTDPEVNAHLEWLGFVRPTGLVVSALALVKAGAILNRSDREGQELVRAQLQASPVSEAIPGYGPAAENPPHPLVAFRPFAESVLRWSFGSSDYAGTPEFPVPADLALRLPDSDELFRPTYAVRERNPSSPGTINGDTEASPWQLLVSVMDQVDDPDTATDKKHGVSPHFQMERLLREARVPAGLLATRRGLRLMAAPRGESAGWLDFRFADMEQTAGRPIVAAMRLLLGEERLLSLPKDKRLPALLAASRAFQNQVSEELAVQVLHALYELLRGFQAADHASKNTLLHEYRTDAKSDLVYRGLLSVILRLVFLLYAEERDLLSQNATFLRSYSLLRLYERLQEDAAESPDTMDQRFGAWSQLVALFRLVHDGAAAGDLHLPARQGALFNPESYLFLEGRTSARHSGTRLVAPEVAMPGWVLLGSRVRPNTYALRKTPRGLTASAFAHLSPRFLRTPRAIARQQSHPRRLSCQLPSAFPECSRLAPSPAAPAPEKETKGKETLPLDQPSPIRTQIHGDSQNPALLESH